MINRYAAISGHTKEGVMAVFQNYDQSFDFCKREALKRRYGVILIDRAEEQVQRFHHCGGVTNWTSYNVFAAMVDAFEQNREDVFFSKDGEDEWREAI